MNEQKLSELQKIYDGLPKMQCQGKCQQSCGPIAFHPIEIDNLRRHQIPIPQMGKDLTCSALSCLGNCSIYHARPMICRLWGLVPKMACPFGCKPERWLTDEEAASLLLAIAMLKLGKPTLTVDIH